MTLPHERFSPLHACRLQEINCSQETLVIYLGENVSGINGETAAQKLRGRAGSTVRVKLNSVSFHNFPSSCNCEPLLKSKSFLGILSNLLQVSEKKTILE